MIKYINDFGIEPNSSDEAGEAFARAIDFCRAQNGQSVVLKLKPGTYNFYAENAIKKVYYISNTSTNIEVPEKTKHIGVLFDGVKNITLDGCGSELVFHGKFTQIVFDRSENITVMNLMTDYSRPTMSEITAIKRTTRYCDFTVNEDSAYEVRDGFAVWTGRNFEYITGPTQIFDGEKTWRCKDFGYRYAEQKDGFLRFYGEKTGVKVGQKLQIRDGIRDEVGMFAVHSKDITLIDVTAHYFHGMGFLGQFSENITLDRFNTVPNKKKGRTNSCFADSIHISGCKGKLVIKDGEFDGTQDDILNVHGTHLKIVEINDKNTLTVRFCHGQTYGFEAFFAGDEVELVNENTLLAYQTNYVVSAELVNEYEMKLTLKDAIPDGVMIGNVVENVTWQPEVEFIGNKIRNDPTRGVLLSSRKRTVVKNNEFYKTGMSAVLIADDARSWFESGHAYDVVIENNRFIECGEPTVFINPESSKRVEDGYIHKNIRIENNEIVGSCKCFVSAKSVDGLTVCGNTFT